MQDKDNPLYSSSENLAAGPEYGDGIMLSQIDLPDAEDLDEFKDDYGYLDVGAEHAGKPPVYDVAQHSAPVQHIYEATELDEESGEPLGFVDISENGAYMDPIAATQSTSDAAEYDSDAEREEQRKAAKASSGNVSSAASKFGQSKFSMSKITPPSAPADVEIDSDAEREEQRRASKNKSAGGNGKTAASIIASSVSKFEKKSKY